MRVKIGDEWYEPTPEKPIMVEMSAHNFRAISTMEGSSNRFAAFHLCDMRSDAEKAAWVGGDRQSAKRIK